MSFDYSKLRGRIKEKYGTQGKFAKDMCWSPQTACAKLKNQQAWKQTEILSACELLNIPHRDIQKYFFTPNVQIIEQN